jgi:hypothetical protein
VICDFHHVSIAPLRFATSVRLIPLCLTIAYRFLSSTTMASGGLTGSARPQASHPHFHRHNVEDLFDVAADQDQRFARDIEWKVVGPMPVDVFLESFLSHRTRIPRFEDVTFSGIPDEPDRESVIYSSLVRGWLLFVVPPLTPPPPPL